MVLGAHPALVGADPDTGVVFVDTAVEPIKHKLWSIMSGSGQTLNPNPKPEPG